MRYTIQSLETESAAHGDLLMAAICQIAVVGRPLANTLNALDDEDRVRLSQRFGNFDGHPDGDWRQLAAKQECEEVIERAANAGF